MAEGGDWARKFVLDPAIADLLKDRQIDSALDVGCGEGRSCRMLTSNAARVTGIDPTAAFIKAARKQDKSSTYIQAKA